MFLLCISALCSGCGKAYDVKPIGTNDTTVIGTYEIPAEYTSVTEVTVEETGKQEKEVALKRKENFENLFANNTLTVDITKVKTVEDTVTQAHFLCVYDDTKVYFATYDTEDNLVQEIVGENDTVYSINPETKEYVSVLRDEYKLCDKEVLKQAYTKEDMHYVCTYVDVINKRELNCDEYTVGSNTVRMYYDTADNLIIYRETNDTEDVTTLFNVLTSIIETDFWDVYTFNEKE